MKRPTLSERERRYVEALMGAAAGNATKAATLAGYSGTSAARIGHRLSRKVRIQRAIAERAQSDPAVWTREDRQRFWTAVASGAAGYAKAALRDRLKASELLGKSQADFVERLEQTGRVTLEQVLGASRQLSSGTASAVVWPRCGRSSGSVVTTGELGTPRGFPGVTLDGREEEALRAMASPAPQKR